MEKCSRLAGEDRKRSNLLQQTFFFFLNSNLRGLVKGAFVTMVPLLNEPPL